MAWRSRGGGRSGSSSRGSRPKGQVRGGKSVQYSITSPRGRKKYYGVTNNPSRRARDQYGETQTPGGDF